ncbi:MAG: hypothetical protein AB1598_06315 [Thermodesulfobacteriota bacterium]
MTETKPGAGSEKSLEADVDKYYYYVNMITENVRNGYNFMVVKYCDLSLPLIPSLIEYTKRFSGEFDVTTVPAIELGARIWSHQGRRDKIDELASLVSAHPELSPWQLHIDRAYETLRETEE